MKSLEDDLSFGRVAVRLGFCSEKQIKQSLAEQRRREIEGKFDRLGSVLVERGSLTKIQLDRVLKMQKESEGRTHIRGYEILSEIGRGAMGIVYRARQLSLDREVALKMIPKGPQVDKAFRERFLREAKSAAMLSHPNIVKAIDAGESQAFFYFAMELFEAPHLLQIVRKREKIPEEELLPIAIQMASALDHAHEHSLVHRDVKPENILFLEEKGMAKLTDMGLARSTSPEAKRLTQTGTTMGTPYYMSPEAVKGLSDIDIRADIYSLGATLYHLATGRVPFDAETAFLVLRMHLDTPLAPPKQINPKLSDTLNRIILKMMRKDPNRRYADPAELLEDLHRLKDMGPRAASRSKKSAAIPAKRKRSNVPVIAASVAALAVLAAAAGFFALRGGGEEKSKAKDGGKGKVENRGGREKKESPSRRDSHGDRDVSKPDAEPPSPGEEDLERGRRALREIQNYAREHPEDAEGIVARFENLAREFPGLAETCSEKAALWKARANELALENLFTEAKDLIAKRKYGYAIRILHAYPLQHRVPPDMEQEIKKLGNETLVRAKSDARMKERRARGLLASGDPEGAIRLMKEVLVFEIVVLTAKAKNIIREFRIQGELTRLYHEHAEVLKNVERFGLHGARDRLPKSEKGDLEEQNLRDAWNALEAAVHNARRRRGKTEDLILRDGSRIRGKIARVTDRELVLQAGRPSDPDSTYAWNRISLESVRDLGGSSASGFPLAALAWYLYRDTDRAREILDTMLHKGGRAKALEELMEGTIGLELDAGMHSVEVAIEKGSLLEAKRILRRLLALYRDTPAFLAREGNVRKGFALSGRGAWEETILPFLFRGEVKRSGEGIRISYDFLRANQFLDFRGAQAASFEVREGRIAGKATEAGEGILTWPGRWSQIEASLDADLPEGGGMRIVFQPPGGLYTAFEVQRKDGKIGGCIRRMMPDGRLWTARKFKGSKAVPGGVHLRLGWVKGQLWARIGEGKQESVREDSGGTITLAFGVFGRFSVPSIEINGVLERGWVESLQAWEAQHSAFVEGRAVDLIGKVPLDRWRREGGRVSRQEQSLRLEGEGEGMKIWLPEARTLVRKGIALDIALEVKRISDRGFFFVTFNPGEKDIAWLFTPEREEPPPAGAPRDFPVLSMCPFSDGEWHRILFEVREDTATMYFDGGLRDVFALEDLQALNTGALKPRGLGFGAIGGRWLVRSFKIRRAGK